MPSPLIYLPIPASELEESELHAYDRKLSFDEFVRRSAALLSKASKKGFSPLKTHLIDTVDVAIPLPQLSDVARDLPFDARANFNLPPADMMRIQTEADKQNISADERLRRGIRFGNFVATHVIEDPVFIHNDIEVKLPF